MGWLALFSEWKTGSYLDFGQSGVAWAVVRAAADITWMEFQLVGMLATTPLKKKGKQSQGEWRARAANKMGWLIARARPPRRSQSSSPPPCLAKLRNSVFAYLDWRPMLYNIRNEKKEGEKETNGFLRKSLIFARSVAGCWLTLGFSQTSFDLSPFHRRVLLHS